MIWWQNDSLFVAFHPFVANKSPNKGINQYSLRYALDHAPSAIPKKRHRHSGGSTFSSYRSHPVCLAPPYRGHLGGHVLRTAAILAALLPYRCHLGGPVPRTAAILAARCRTAAILAALSPVPQPSWRPRPPYRRHLGGPAPVPQPSWRPRSRTAAILAAPLPYRSHLGGPLSYRSHLGGHVAEQAPKTIEFVEAHVPVACPMLVEAHVLVA